MNNRTKTTLALSLLVLAGLAGIVFHADGIVYGQSAYAFSPDTLRQDTTKNKRPDGTRTSNPVTDLTLQDLIPPAPAAMEIAKGIAYPVDLSSGLLNIEIPLYEIVSGDIRIPITLSYHASGLKPGIHSRTWLPQGWSLSVGPTLSRVIRGGPDEYVYDAATAAAASPTWTQLNAVAEQAVDIALDEFFYSLPGHSGKLYFTRTPSGGFSSTLRYTDPSRSTTTGKYDGSISEWTWSRETGSTAQTYGFSYDGLGRLTGTKRYTDNGTTATNAFTEQGLVYDRNGNVTNVTRYGSSASSAEDIFTFTLTGNRISSLTNAGTNGSGVTYTSFTYDANGNTTHDGRTGQDLSWNMLNLIGGVSTTSGNTTTQLASYSWYADGTKYSAERPDGSGYVYKGNVIYEKAAGGALTLDCVLTTGGRIVANKNASGTITGYTVYHHITDHLGSVRAITDAGTGTVVETSDFLPFGTRWSQTSGSSSATITDATNRWRYSGKEEQKAINAALPLIDYGARMYDPAIARWMSVDPMAEKYYPMSTYGYCVDSPVSFIDPKGMEWEKPKEAERLKKSIDKKITSLNNDIAKDQAKIAGGGLNEKQIARCKGRISEANERLSNLNTSKADIDLLGEDPNNVYAFRTISGGKHHVLQGEDGKIYIETSSNAVSIHEITHIRQSLKAGGLRFLDGKLRNAGTDIDNFSQMEIDAYKQQYSYDESFPGSLRGKGLQGIDVFSVGSIKNDAGEYVYRAIYEYSLKLN